jgi:ferredoxin
MLDNFEKTCAALGHTQAHIERFSAVEVAASADAKASFTVELRSSGKTFEVTPDTTLHKQLIASGVFIPFSCEEGICGSCETHVLEGEVTTATSLPAERAKSTVMMVVYRAARARAWCWTCRLTPRPQGKGWCL